ncbi:hypothetical protein Trco_001479 [Trichoderma cornu-damae]|uniref:Secretory lipase n=1 Tax=Trichoderma cornu-damae TaxID=654480 RepID=A0A9P8QUD8_9HYPO|nr:hypothetical protein Trco_001479 [Trichoderma cornu-damae]
MLLKLASLAALAVPGVVAQAAFPDISASKTCDALCQSLAKMGWEYETSHHVDPGFYVTPSNFSSHLKAGSVLGVEVSTNLTGYTVPSGLTMSRIIYTTTDLNGKVLPASAYILWPANKPLKRDGCSDAFPMVAWAHGTAGAFAACAPSDYTNLQYDFMVPYALALQGIVVVAADYAGLGIGSLPNGDKVSHAYGASPAQANDVANAIIAARSAFPLLAKSPFVTAGHSQGGGVAWAFAERQVKQPVEGYAGTVAWAPPSDIIGVIAEANRDLAQGNVTASTYSMLGFVQRAVIAGITSVYPQFNFTGMTDIVYDRYQNVMAKIQACLPTDGLVYATVGITDLGVASWTNTSIAQEFRARTKTGGNQIAGPLLVMAGASDSAVSLKYVQALVQETCDANSKGRNPPSIEFFTYEGQDHFPLIQASHSHWMQWIKDRLHEASKDKPTKALPGGCSKHTVEAFRSEFNQKQTLPNWLLEKASPQEIWKYIF